MSFPRMLRLRQKFDCPRVDDIPDEVDRQLATLRLAEKVKPGQTVAITVGSRGIANIAVITKSIVEHFKRLKAVPFIVPAMGSHGGGTAEGQRQIVEGYGITEDYVGAEIRSSMETAIVDKTPQGIPVHFDRQAYGADHVVVSGRVKPHTGFVGEIESGLHKMMLIGLGKHEGAKVYHRAITDYSWLEIVTAVAESVLKKCKVVCGVGIVENAYDETALIAAVPPHDFLNRERELLVLAKKWMPRLPFKKVDMLIVDELGKNISGSGMDTNVIGRKYNDHRATELDSVAVKTIFVRGLTEATHGNACGLGMSEFTNDRTIAAVDKRITAINAITGGHAPAASLPISFKTDRDVLEAAFPTIGLTEPERSRVLHISNTLQLAELLASEAYLPLIESRDDLEIVEEPRDMEFDEEGNLYPVAAATAGVH
ncbi:MAG TPA: lactate racemase domain-containing protein [Planctomycetaceae bacterium]|nr:lactate racemase domain-containing protein [Planctomycetaceae bacterium]